MTKKMLRRIVAVIFAMIIVAGTMLTAFADSSQYVSYESYTYWDNISGSGRKLVYNRPMFETKNVYSTSEIGTDPATGKVVDGFSITELVDVCTDLDGNIYLLDYGKEGGANAKVIKLNANYEYIGTVEKVVGPEVQGENGEVTREEYTFTGAENIYVHSDKTLYICDTLGKRVFRTDLNGNLLDTFVLPKPDEKNGSLIPSDFKFIPVKVVADSRGYIYILSEGSYYGALLYAPDKTFIGFYGANTVTNGILGALDALMNRMFPNNEKKKNQKRALPFTFTDIVIDNKDFIYTATDAANKGQLRKLNPGAGNNILDSDNVNFADDSVNYSYWTAGGSFGNSINGLAVDDNEFMYALDINFGRVFVYDAQCRMLTAFGGGMNTGTQEGTFYNASAISLKGQDILVVDQLNNNLTVFTPTDYGSKVLALTRMTIDGDYEKSREGWEEVLKLDKNLQVAYTGLARAYLADGEYKQAMDIALEGFDRETYALAYEYERQEILAENFVWLFTGVVLIAAVVIVLVILNKRRKKAVEVSGDGEVKLMFRTLIHPGLGFEEIKDKKRGSFKVALVILTLFYVSSVIQTLWGGVLFTNYDPGLFNSLWVFVQSFGLIILWVVANWLVTSLASGKGKLKEIFVVTCYALVPIIVERLIWIALSNILLPEEGSFLGILSTVSLLYTGLLLIIGMLRIHDYTMGKFVGTTLLSVLGMAAIVFLIILVVILLQQLGGFIMTLFTEILM